MKIQGVPTGMLERIPRVQRMLLLVAIVLVATIMIGMSVIYTPWQQRRMTLMQQYSDEVQRASVIAAIKSQEEQLAAREKSFLLESGETPALTSEVTRIASRMGVAIESVIPQTEMRIGSYTKLQIRVVATAAYSDLVRFINELEKHEPLLKIDALEVGDSGGRPNEDVYRRPETPSGGTSLSMDRQKVRLLISAFAPEKRMPTP
jgi:Tfp pilus assembly protein PilO